MQTIRHPQSDSTILFSLDNATLRIREKRVFEDATWRIRVGDSWAVTGPNGSGKSTLMGAIDGRTPVVGGRVYRSGAIRSAEGIARVSPEMLRGILDREYRLDHMRYAAGNPSGQACGADLLDRLQSSPGASDREPEDRSGIASLMRRYRIGALLDVPIRRLSSGELKRFLLVRALGMKSAIHLFDEPFDGLDAEAQSLLTEDLSILAADPDRTIIVVSHRIEEIPEAVVSVCVTRDCSIEAIGGPELMRRTSYVFERAVGTRIGEAPMVDTLVRSRAGVCTTARRGSEVDYIGEPVVEFRDVHIAYGSKRILSGFSWRMFRGENWCFHGPNGSGKTTVVELICGDNLQAYANDIRVFGNRRGDGESIWELKQRIGVVAPALNLRYTVAADVEEVLLSGFHDSVGLYRRPTSMQLELMGETIEVFGIGGLKGRRFSELSAGERAIVLVARGCIKRPRILILDEPCQGLDAGGRSRVLEVVDAIGEGETTDIIYVTHHIDEIPRCITNILKFPPGPDGWA